MVQQAARACMHGSVDMHTGLSRSDSCAGTNLAIHIIAYVVTGQFRQRLQHAGGGPGHGVGPQIDHVLGCTRPQRGLHTCVSSENPLRHNTSSLLELQCSVKFARYSACHQDVSMPEHCRRLGTCYMDISGTRSDQHMIFKHGTETNETRLCGREHDP